MKGRLSLTEKYTIQGMVHNSKNIEEIATTLDRTEKCITNYVEGELKKLQETVIKANMKETKVDLDKVKKLPKGQAKRTMGFKTVNDKGGVAVMNAATSAVGDDFLKEMARNKITRGARGHLYDANGDLIS